MISGWLNRQSMEMLLKVLVCVVGLLVIAGNHGDASIDNLMLAKSTPLLEDNIKSEDAKLCHRPCKINVKPKRCVFKLTVEAYVTDAGRVALGVAGGAPAQALHVCEHDIVVADVTNRIPDQELAVHWHGLPQRGTPYMDGVPMITQCPVGYGATYRYAFRASAAGTYFYHAYSVSQQADGVYGALVVSRPAPLEPHGALYDYDRGADNTLLLAAIFPELLTANLKDLSQLAPSSLVINGLSDSYKLYVTEGYGYRLRLINAIPVECPLLVSVDEHQLLAIAADGHAVRPTAASRLLLYPGERLDAVVRAGRAAAGRRLRVRGLGACAGLIASAPLHYTGYNFTSDERESVQASEAEEEGLPTALSGQALHAPAPAADTGPPAPAHVARHYLAVDRNTVSFRDADNDFRYISDAIPKKPFFPSQLTTREGSAVQINGKNFLFPSSPLLTQGPDARAAACSLGAEHDQRDVQCTLTLRAQPGDTLELVIVNEGAGSNDSYTFHMHGYSMQVLATMQPSGSQPLTRAQVERWDAEGKVPRNLVDPPLKDTITVPNKGYVVVRMELDNPGAWLLECHACALSSLPAAMLLHVPANVPKSVVGVLPRCGSFRPPDVLLN